MQKIFKIFIIFILANAALKAQQMPLSNQYYLNKSSFFPAFSGFSGNIESFLSYRISWLGINGAPQSGFLNINGALNDKMGAGFTVISDKSGNFSNSFISATYAYHIPFSDDFFLSAAISPMFYRNQLNFSTINSHGATIDPFLNTHNLSVTTYDLGVSLALNAYKLHFAVSVPQTLALKSNYAESGLFQLDRHLYGLLSYTIALENFTIEPMAFVGMTLSSPLYYSGSVMVRYKNKIWANVGYNAQKSAIISVGVLSGSSLVLNYSYEIGFGGISQNSIGTHELTIGLLIKPAKKFNPFATIFNPSESGVIGTDDNLTNKVAMLDEQLKKEKQDRAVKDADLQRQIDSLKQAKGITNGNVSTNPEETHYVQRIVTQSITFGFMNANILPSSYSELEKYASKLQQDPSLKMKIIVYTDNLFNDQVNKQVSQQRAKAIYDYMIKLQGINATQIDFAGLGSVDPVADNTTPEGREQNNRVEILYTKKVF